MDLDHAEIVDMSLSTRDVKVACTTLYRNIVPHLPFFVNIQVALTHR